MAKKKIIKEEVVETAVEAVEETVEAEVTTSEYESFKALIENYAKQNPAKYEQKKESLLSTLKTLK